MMVAINDVKLLMAYGITDLPKNCLAINGLSQPVRIFSHQK